MAKKHFVDFFSSHTLSLIQDRKLGNAVKNRILTIFPESYQKGMEGLWERLYLKKFR